MKWWLERYDGEWWIRVRHDMIQLREKEVVNVEVEDLFYVGSSKKIKNEMVKLFRKLYGKEVKKRKKVT